MKKLIPLIFLLSVSCSKSSTNTPSNPSQPITKVLTATLSVSTNTFTLSINKYTSNNQITGNISWSDHSGFPIKLLITSYIGGLNGTAYQTVINVSASDISPMLITPITVVSGSEVSDIKIQVN